MAHDEYTTLKEAENRFYAIMQKKGKATLSKEEKEEVYKTVPEEIRACALKNATWKFRERKQIEKLNQFLEDHMTITVPGTVTVKAAVRPVIYQTRQGDLLALDGLNIPAMALVGVNADGHLACKLITKGREVSNELSVSYGNRELKKWVTSKVKSGLTQAINDMLYSMTFDDIVKAIIKQGKASNFKDARSVTEEMASFVKWDYEGIKAEAKQLRTCKVIKKATKTA